jgi:hypothetical protein
MTDEQFYLLIGVPILANTILFTLFFVCIRAKFSALDRRFDGMRDPGGLRCTAPGKNSAPD